VTYFKNKVLELEFTDNGQKGWQSCFVVSNVTLPDTGYIGFSSLTGDAHDNHEIHRVSSYVHLDVGQK
jgi:mannose-binding lectin 2